jgi:hypothetical protein
MKIGIPNKWLNTLGESMKFVLLLTLIMSSMSVFSASEKNCHPLPPSPAGVQSQQNIANKYVTNGVAIAFAHSAIDAVKELSDAIENSKDSELMINYRTAVKKPLTLSAISVTERNDGNGCSTFFASVSVNGNN